MSAFPDGDPEFEATYAQEAAMIDTSELLAEVLETTGHSKADLARLLGVSRSEITSRLQGERNITIRTLAATLHALDHRLRVTAEPAMTAAVPIHPYADWRARSPKTSESPALVGISQSNLLRFQQKDRRAS